MSPRKKILVCDDEADIRTVVGLNLGLAGFDFGEATDGDDALDQLRKDSWDGIVLDLMMPNTDGFHVLQKIGPEGDIAIVVLSARNTPQAALHALQLGAHAHVTKPFSPVALSQLLEELIMMSSEERQTRRQRSIERATTLDRMGMPTI